MNTSCDVNETMSRNASLATVYSLVLIAGLPLNGLSLWILLKRHRLKSTNTIFMTNLALSDLVLALSLPLRIYYHANAEWIFGAVVCALTTMLFRVNITSSSIFITFISVDRLLAVVFPLRSRTVRTPTFSVVTCVATWVLLLIVSIPQAIDYIRHIKDDSKCFVQICPNSLVLHVFILIISLLLVNIVSTMMVMRTLHRRQTDTLESHRRIMLIFVVNLLMFAVFFVPLGTAMILMYLKQIDNNPLQWTVCFATLNCCFDPLIYYFSLDAFWKRPVDQSSTIDS